MIRAGHAPGACQACGEAISWREGRPAPDAGFQMKRHINIAEGTFRAPRRYKGCIFRKINTVAIIWTETRPWFRLRFPVDSARFYVTLDRRGITKELFGLGTGIVIRQIDRYYLPDVP